MEREYTEYEMPTNVNYAAKAQARPDVGLSDEAQRTLSAAHQLHELINQLEMRVFGPEPREIETAEDPSALRPPPVLASTIRNARQRLESANGRLSKVLARL